MIALMRARDVKFACYKVLARGVGAGHVFANVLNPCSKSELNSALSRIYLACYILTDEQMLDNVYRLRNDG